MYYLPWLPLRVIQSTTVNSPPHHYGFLGPFHKRHPIMLFRKYICTLVLKVLWKAFNFGLQRSHYTLVCINDRGFIFHLSEVIVFMITLFRSVFVFRLVQQENLVSNFYWTKRLITRTCLASALRVELRVHIRHVTYQTLSCGL